MDTNRSQAAKDPFHVLIVGAGIGGLCLAQGLRKSGIRVSVYERDSSPYFRNQGYRISLKQEGSQALHDCLPENLFQLAVATAIKPATRMVFLDYQLNQKFARPIPPLPQDLSFGVHRLSLREILLADLEDVVHFGKTFVRFDQRDDDPICVSFADGTQAHGDLLVGADGTYSIVRSLLVPDARLDNLGCAIYGKTPITTTTLKWMPEVLIDSFNRMTAPNGLGLSVATCRKREVWQSALARYAPRLHLTDIPDYLSWTLSRPGEQYQSADSKELHHQACTMLSEWPPEVARIVEEAEPTATFLVTLHSALPVSLWDTTRVTLLGDAIHAMSPGRGEGANTALRDAQLLHHVLLDVQRRGVPLVQAKVQYETAMLRYGFDAVNNSREKPFAASPRWS